MQCPTCHTQLPQQSLFCPQCGKRLGKRSDWRLWLLVGGFLAALIGAWIAFTHFSLEPLEKPILSQLEALKSQQVTEGYINFTSQNFRQLTSLEKFKEFVRTYPILVHHQPPLFGTPLIEKDHASLTLYLNAKGQNEAEVSYQLIRENRNWKIDSIQLMEYRKEAKEELANPTASMIQLLETQLKALKNKDLVASYKNLVSKQFQAETPFEAFKAFVVTHPLLTQFEEYDFRDHSIADNRGIATVMLNQIMPVEYRTILEGGQWKILMMRIETPPSVKQENSNDPAAMIDLVREELSLFQKGDLRQVYENQIAKETQNGVTFESFESFIQKYPALIKHTSVNIREPTLEKGLGRVIAEAVDEKGKTVIEYNLILEAGHWKILGMHIASTPEEPDLEPAVEASPSSFKVRELVGVIENFLAALRSGDLSKAFELTSKDFQFSNSQTDFNQFFTKHPEFAQSKGSSFEKEMFNNAIATFSGQLILNNSEVMPVEFDLVFEENRWKILHLYALPLTTLPTTESKPLSGSSSKILEFAEMQLGTKVDDTGSILNPVTIFKPNSGDLFMRLKILNGTPGVLISITMRHVESGSNLKPVNATLTDSGSETMTFLFSPPPQGWPKGNYQLRASSSTNVYKTFTFTVE
jgi:hypothetical protein